ncbi:Uncharacterised protein [Yersinia similis]|nr:Uncharacterised protein [Yersinia similis]
MEDNVLLIHIRWKSNHDNPSAGPDNNHSPRYLAPVAGISKPTNH